MTATSSAGGEVWSREANHDSECSVWSVSNLQFYVRGVLVVDVFLSLYHFFLKPSRLFMSRETHA